jgi:hypothetical protein
MLNQQNAPPPPLVYPKSGPQRLEAIKTGAKDWLDFESLQRHRKSAYADLLSSDAVAANQLLKELVRAVTDVGGGGVGVDGVQLAAVKRAAESDGQTYGAQCVNNWLKARWDSAGVVLLLLLGSSMLDAVRKCLTLDDLEPGQKRRQPWKIPGLDDIRGPRLTVASTFKTQLGDQELQDEGLVLLPRSVSDDKPSIDPVFAAGRQTKGGNRDPCDHLGRPKCVGEHGNVCCENTAAGKCTRKMCGVCCSGAYLTDRLASLSEVGVALCCVTRHVDAIAEAVARPLRQVLCKGDWHRHTAEGQKAFATSIQRDEMQLHNWVLTTDAAGCVWVIATQALQEWMDSGGQGSAQTTNNRLWAVHADELTTENRAVLLSNSVLESRFQMVNHQAKGKMSGELLALSRYYAVQDAIGGFCYPTLCPDCRGANGEPGAVRFAIVRGVNDEQGNQMIMGLVTGNGSFRCSGCCGHQCRFDDMGVHERLREIFYGVDDTGAPALFDDDAPERGRMGNCAHSFHTFVNAILEPLALAPATAGFARQLDEVAARWLSADKDAPIGGMSDEADKQFRREVKVIRIAAASKAAAYVKAVRKRELQLDSTSADPMGSAGVHGRALNYYVIFELVDVSPLQPCHLVGKMAQLVRAPEVTLALKRGWRPLVGTCDVEYGFSNELLRRGRFWGRMPGPHEDLANFRVQQATYVAVSCN